MIRLTGLILLLFASPAYGQLTDERHKYHAFIPPTADEELTDLFSDTRVSWYTDTEMQPLFQHHFGSRSCQMISVNKDIGPGGPRFSNGNGEWPWAHPATLNVGQTKNIKGVRITGVQRFRATFPQWSIVRSNGIFHHHEMDPSSYGEGWRFNEGTEFVEINTTRIGQSDYPFKIHRMTMVGNEWQFKVYRPFSVRKEYETATGTRAVSTGLKTLRDNHMISAYEETRQVLKVPAISPSLSIKLLTETPFMLCTDDDFIPTTDHPDQIYPAGYLGPWIGNGTDQSKCRNCHRDVAVNVRKFDVGEWYGQIRGGGKDRHGAGVFSWHPFGKGL